MSFRPVKQVFFWESIMKKFVRLITILSVLSIALSLMSDQPADAQRSNNLDAPGAIFTVTNTNDSGAGSFRQAITDSNNAAGTDTISFNIAGAGVRTITPLSPLPTITGSAIIDATTQPGFAGVPLIELNGVSAGNTNGFVINSNDSTLRGFIINRFQSSGIIINGNNNTVAGNFIGTSANGMAPLANNFGGVLIFSPASNNLIGGATAADRNVISGNQITGLAIQSASTVPPATGNRVQGNFIGVAADGITPLGNTAGSQVGWGVVILRLASANLIGGTGSGEGNIIANNAGPGVQISGTAAPNGPAVANSVLNNSIYNNGGLGIDLQTTGVTLNDLNDTDAGSNNLQNFPTLTAVNESGSNTTIQGSLNSVPNTSFLIQFFSSPACDSSGYGEGRIFVGSANVTTAGSGNAVISSTFTGVPTTGYLTSVATRLDGGNNPLDTSEFSACLSRQQVNLKADYQFQGNLNSTVVGAPPMSNLTGSGGPNSFVADTLDGYARQSLRFPFNSGLAVSTAGGLIPNGSYTIVMLFRFDQVDSFRRVASFDNRTSDNGAYIENGRFEGEPLANPAILPNNYVQAVLVRDESGRIQAYRDGVLRIDQTEPNFVISPANVLSFFQDDAVPVTPEASAGNVARIRLYDGPLSAPQVQALDRAPPGTPTAASDIAFVSNRDGNFEIYGMKADGSDQVRITNNPASDFYPDWSPDGSKILFYSSRDGNNEIYSMNADGSSQTRITNDPASDRNGVWSPDGSRIAYESNRDGDFEIYVLNLITSTTTQLTNNTATDFVANWSPDGTQLTFTSNRDGDQEIFKMNADGSNQTQLTFNTVNENDSPWSPDGNKIAFWSQRDGNIEIYTMDSDGGNVLRLTNDPGTDDKPSWSPDGSKLVFGSTRVQTGEIYTMDANGTGITQLTFNTANEFTPDWRGQPLPGSPCSALPILFGQAGSGQLNIGSCIVANEKTDLYTFSGTTWRRRNSSQK
jgi:Domain of unknown function (DUF5050)/WD40-like Beta Propeller Repeat